MSVKEKVYVALCNHSKATSYGIANLICERRYAVLRALSELIKDGTVKKQKGRIVDGWPEPRFRCYKLAKTKHKQLDLF